MIIRTARIDELERVNQLRLAVGDLHSSARPDIFRKNAMELRLQNMNDTAAEMLRDEQQNVILCEVDGVVAGFACVEYHHKPETQWAPEQHYCYVREFGVDDAFQHRGIGRALMDYLREESRRRGINRLELDVWAFNEKAMNFYQRQGFKPRYSYMEMDFE